METILFGAAILLSLSYFYKLEVDYLFRVAEKQFIQEQKLYKGPVREFDFIIVGAGTAGCLLANRLSAHHSVLLLEAGGPAPSLTLVPAFRDTSERIAEINHEYHFVKQRPSKRKIKVRMGKMMGGSGAHNELFYNRGNSHDFDNWADLTGDKSWKYENVFPIFKELENYNGLFPSDQRGKNGPLPIQTGNQSVLHAYKKAAKELGYEYGDSNGPQKEGFSPMDSLKTKDGRAVTTCTIFIDPILGIRKRLTVKTYAEVTKVHFRKKIAIGVTYSNFGKKMKATARKEIVLSAGTYATPLLLFRSGIGPAKMLAKAKIDVVADLPVGRNLQDHKALNLSVTFGPPIETVYYNLTPANFDVYLKRKADGLLSEAGAKAQAFFVSSIAKRRGERNWPDIQFLWDESSVGSDGRIYVLMTLVVTRPTSSGSVKLNTKAYLSGERRSSRLTVVDYQLFENKEDRRRLLDGVNIVLKIFKTKALKKLDINVVPDAECVKTYLLYSDEYWTCAFKNLGKTYWHPVGTCRMGRGPADPNSVVDSKFRVNGIKNLRVIDASVFPKITNANTNAPTIIVAEKGASTIVKEHKKLV